MWPSVAGVDSGLPAPETNDFRTVASARQSPCFDARDSPLLERGQLFWLFTDSTCLRIVLRNRSDALNMRAHALLLVLHARAASSALSALRALSSAPAYSLSASSSTRVACSRRSIVMSARGRGDDDSAADSSADLSRHNPLFDRFILQRAVQTQIFYLDELHDQPSSRFIANFMDHGGLDRYHGFDGLRVSPEEYIEHLLASPPVTVQVRSSWGSVSWGGSPGNPHLSERKETFHDFTIYPDRVGASILRIRDGIADELSADLDALALHDMDFWRRRERAQQRGTERASAEPGARSSAGRSTGRTHSLATTPPDGAHESTPTRSATYDLLQKLTLHVAVKHTLRGMSRESSRSSKPGELSPRHGWLERVFAESGFLAGDQGFGTSEHFLHSIASRESVALQSEDASKITLVDPQAIANQILDARMLISKHFQRHLRSVHEGHTEHLRNRLERSLRAQFGGQ